MAPKRPGRELACPGGLGGGQTPRWRRPRALQVQGWPALPLVDISTLAAPPPLYIYHRRGRGARHQPEEEAEDGAEAAVSDSSEIGGDLYDDRYY